ncbi:hypothetical protein BGX33_012364 [Mortierella sp. NVP41]|nr:hypothetical protein BGX33_012364 [Mortierella sp. NVP41]
MSLCLRFELYLEKDFSERLKKRRALTVDVCKFFGRQSIADFGWATKKLVKDKVVK